VKILVIGSGAREHAIVRALLRDTTSHQIVAAPGNAGIAEVVEVVSLNIEDGPLIADYAAEQGVELVIIGPEAPLVAGVADALRAVGVPVFGPDKAAAQLEGSKDFAKEVMNAARVPNGRSISATTLREVETALDEFGAPYVVKADGLAAGKGVIVTSDRAAARDHAEFFIHHGPVLVEEFLDGQEVSLFVLSDGDAVVPLSPAQDYKRAFDNDEGPNTGGMGAYSPAPVVTPEVHARAMREIILPTIKGMEKDGIPFTGFLYAGLMIDPQGQVKTLEFNCRMGDPETQPIMARLKTDLVDVLLAATSQHAETRFDDFELDWDRRTAIGVVLAAHGYPMNPRKGDVISGLQQDTDDVVVFHAGTHMTEGHLRTTGGRVMCVTALGGTLKLAQQLAYDTIEGIHFDGMQYRTDIGFRAISR